MTKRPRPDGPKPSLWRTLGAMAGLGIVLLWAFVFLIPPAERMGVPHRYANHIPLAGLLLGFAWGLGLRYSKDARSLLGYVAAPFLVGGVFWFFGLLLGGALLVAGLPPGAADLVPLFGFALGAGLGSAPILAWLVGPRGERRSRFGGDVKDRDTD